MTKREKLMAFIIAVLVVAVIVLGVMLSISAKNADNWQAKVEPFDSSAPGAPSTVQIK